MDDDISRRRALAVAGTAITGGLAGCGSDDGDGSPDGDETDPTGTTPDGTGRGSPTLTADGQTPAGGDTPTDGDAPRDGDTPTDGETPSTTLDEVSLVAERVASGFTSPVDVAIPDPGRRFIVDQAGQIYLQDGSGLRDEPYLDVTDRMVSVGGGLSERGLLGLAFHPGFADNGRLFVRYSAPNRPGTPSEYSHTFVLAEFHADPGADRADPDSERTVLEIPEPQGNHNAGDIAFGPDGYLYVTVGDGGGANDTGLGHVEDWYDGVGGGNGQDVTENLLGSVLRIDVDSEPSETARDGGGGTADDEDGDRNYAVPDDNPLVGADGRDEHYAWGLRNPWRFSFGPDGRLFVADVGQGAWEEIDVVERGGNYGWNVREGPECFQTGDCPDESPDGRPLRDPVVAYPHGGAAVSGISVIGGYRYDGEEIPALRGRYLFGDWESNGELFVAEPADERPWPTATVPVDADASFGPYLLSFGRNPDGELFACTTAESGVQGDSGAVFRLRGP